MLRNNGTIGESDSLALHRFLTTAEDWFKYNQMCKEKGRLVPELNRDGEEVGKKPAAWHKIEQDLQRALDISIRELGLSPVARDSIKKLAVGEKVNKWAIK